MPFLGVSGSLVVSEGQLRGKMSLWESGGILIGEPRGGQLCEGANPP